MLVGLNFVGIVLQLGNSGTLTLDLSLIEQSQLSR
jgi:hypothetical protein